MIKHSYRGPARVLQASPGQPEADTGYVVDVLYLSEGSGKAYVEYPSGARGWLDPRHLKATWRSASAIKGG